jgi:DNA-binding MarR family transcriptional regulator
MVMYSTILAGKESIMPKVPSKADATVYELSCTHTSLRRAARQLTQLYDDALAPSGLTSAQAMLVSQIDEMSDEADGAGPSLQKLAQRLAIQISALSHALKPLVRDGLVIVSTDASDRRTKRALLTAQGKAQTKHMYALWGQTNQRIGQVLGDGVTDQLRLLADQVASPDFAEAFRRAAQ